MRERFIARRSGGSRWLLTMGHCMNALDRIWQGDRNINPMEHRALNAFGDVGGANLVSALQSNYVYESSSVTQRQITRWYGRDDLGVGADVAVSRGNSNSSVITRIDAVRLTRTYDNQFTVPYTVEFLKQAQNQPCVGGDSGSPVYTAHIAEGALISCANDDLTWVQISRQMSAGGFIGLLTTPPPY
jgi:hypothetical protein